MWSKIKELHNVGQDGWQNHLWVIEIKDCDRKKTPALSDSGAIKFILGQETLRKSSLTLFYALGKIPGHHSEKMRDFLMDYLYT